jgi:hypothetical protein
VATGGWRFRPQSSTIFLHQQLLLKKINAAERGDKNAFAFLFAPMS